MNSRHLTINVRLLIEIQVSGPSPGALSQHSPPRSKATVKLWLAASFSVLSRLLSSRVCCCEFSMLLHPSPNGSMLMVHPVICRSGIPRANSTCECQFFTPGLWWYVLYLMSPATKHALTEHQAGAFGNLIAGGILDGLDGARGISAWQWLYIIEGV